MGDGEAREWTAVTRARRVPSRWTRPLRYAVVAYLSVAVLQWLVTSVLFLNTADMERSLHAQNPNLAADQLRAAADFAVAVGWLTTVIVIVLMLILAVGTLRGWRWAFWGSLAWLCLSSLGIVTNIFGLLDPAAESQPLGAVLFSLLVAVVALALALWCVVAATRYGPWAMQKENR
jgi:hypothetical protein